MVGENRIGRVKKDKVKEKDLLCRVWQCLATLRSEKGGPEGAEDTSGVEKSKMNVNKESEIGGLNDRLRILNFTINEVVK